VTLVLLFVSPVPPKKDKKKKGGGDGPPAPPVELRPVKPVPPLPTDVLPLATFVGDPNVLLPEWDDAAIAEEDWMFDNEDGKKFEDPDVMGHFPAHLMVEEQRKLGSVKEGCTYATATQWLRPSEFIKQPPQPVLSEEEQAALEEKKRQEEEEKKKAKGTTPKTGEEEEVVELPPGTVVPCIVMTAEEEQWDNLDADAKKTIEANPEGDHPGPPDMSAPVTREYTRGFQRYWSEKQKDEILVEANMIAAWLQAKKEKEEAKELAKAEAEELGEEWYDDDELMGIVEEDEPQPLERTEEGPEVEAMIASYFRVLLSHTSNVLQDDPFLWEAIYPQKNGRPIYNPAGKYAVKVFAAGKWRKLLIDDRIPCDDNRTPCFVRSTKPGELWPSLLSKAIYKLINLYGVDLLTNPALNSTEICGLTLHSLAGWLPQVFPVFQGNGKLSMCFCALRLRHTFLRASLPNLLSLFAQSAAISHLVPYTPNKLLPTTQTNSSQTYSYQRDDQQKVPPHAHSPLAPFAPFLMRFARFSTMRKLILTALLVSFCCSRVGKSGGPPTCHGRPGA
jgi:hypothetical protein